MLFTLPKKYRYVLFWGWLFAGDFMTTDCIVAMRSCENNTTAAGFIYPLRVSRGKRQLLQSVNHLFSVFCFCILFFFRSAALASAVCGSASPQVCSGCSLAYSLTKHLRVRMSTVVLSLFFSKLVWLWCFILFFRMPSPGFVCNSYCDCMYGVHTCANLASFFFRLQIQRATRNILEVTSISLAGVR